MSKGPTYKTKVYKVQANAGTSLSKISEMIEDVGVLNIDATIDSLQDEFEVTITIAKI
jgi:hypothetical protein